ncbi:MAG TPA: N-acetylmuramoyl-L-alanine amidase [Vicinamibacterales bacterium]|nr:N-acetylmuramoyl-L-alanine amidase [Vicinamibacterales bacterium]
MPKASGDLIIGGQRFNVDAPVVNWTEGPRWDATSEFGYNTKTDPDGAIRCKGGVPYGKLPLGPYTRRYSFRPRLRQFGKNPPYEAVKSAVRQFVIHHDGCTSSDMCFSVLQNERGLSVHFMIDNDGTIYQTIDLGLMAYHAAEWNIDSIGVELCNKGDATQYPGLYTVDKPGSPRRDTQLVKINNNTIKAYTYTHQQMDALQALGKALLHLLPNLPAEFPQASAGKQEWNTIPKDASMRFSGYIGHYHLWNQKWDPGPFDFEKFCRSLRGSLCFPVFPKNELPAKPDLIPEVPKQTDDLTEAAKNLYKANELRADGGFFPVGPWGEARLWHGGVHLAMQADAPVFAPFPGRLVAARMGKSTAIGSANFVLLRHDMTLAATRVQFYSLYMHLADELAATTPPEWMAKSDAWKKDAKPGAVVLLDEPIEAGQKLGRVGTAGPAELSKPQMHLEFFSTAELFSGLPGASIWTVIDGTSGGRFCDSSQINDVIDANHDGMLSKQELQTYFTSGSGSALHFMVPLFVSEWTGDPDWSEALRVPKDFRTMKPADIDQLVADQITPGLWWDDKVAQHCRLPADGIVYHYHPVAFLAWFNQQLLDAAATGPQAIDANAVQKVPSNITDDGNDLDGSSMRSSADVAEDPCNQKLTLNELVQGFDAPDCQ